jgi:D-arabinose 1-dehydrogenase-like Zn-dependent alcohol dehydrogenase
MQAFGVDKPGMHMGVVGLGGLGHMAVKFSKAFGQTCTVLSRSYKKQDLAKELGADNFVATSDADAVSGMSEQLDAIIDTVSGDHDINQLLGMLKVCTYRTVPPFEICRCMF